MKTREIAEHVDGELVGDGDIDITSVAALGNAGTGQIAFSDKTEPDDSEASCLIVPRHASVENKSYIRVEDPKLAFTIVAKVLHADKRYAADTHPAAVVSATAEIGSGVSLGAFTCVGDGTKIGDRTVLRAGAKIGDNVTVGKDCVIHANVFIEDGCTLGDNVILHSGAVIGAPGFGYVRDRKGEYHQFPQIGTVVIEDNVEVGANTCIDRGALGETRIGSGTKIDNLCQIAHNVQIGKRVVIAAQTGIAGSAVIGDDCVLAGGVGIADHTRLDDGTTVGLRGLVFPGKVLHGGVWGGSPVMPMDKYKEKTAVERMLPELRREVRRLKDTVRELSRSEPDADGQAPSE